MLGLDGVYVHSMYLEDDAPIAGGRELWGFSQKTCFAEDRSRERRAGRHAALRLGALRLRCHGLQAPSGRSRHGAEGAELRQPAHLRTRALYLEDVTLKDAWTGPTALGLFPHALADVVRLPVHEVDSALHFKADLTLGLGTVAFDYLAK